MPRLSTSIPTVSSPRPSVYGRRPMQTSTTSASSTSSEPPLAASVVTLSLVLSFSMPVTLRDSLKLMPCFSNRRLACLETSPSMPGSARSRNSTTVTSAPRRRQTEPSSSPITPAPMTISFLGTSLSSRAPVEETMRSSSISTPGSGVTSEPVAMTMFLAESSVSLPSSPVTITLPLPAMRPLPRT